MSGRGEAETGNTNGVAHGPSLLLPFHITCLEHICSRPLPLRVGQYTHMAGLVGSPTFRIESPRFSAACGCMRSTERLPALSDSSNASQQPEGLRLPHKGSSLVRRSLPIFMPSGNKYTRIS